MSKGITGLAMYEKKISGAVAAGWYQSSDFDRLRNLFKTQFDKIENAYTG